ncbi:MAG: hypothetical protein ACERJ1_16880 [Halodesulfovibrio sp.]|uniref:hypothetical protein n=1 Tax=Halodesulfovibrio sp. TaxID=1912772 RepID=UPI00359ED963
MLDSLVGTILTDARTVLDDLDPFLLDLEVSAERADTVLLSTIYNTTPLLSNCFNLLGLTDAVALVDLLQLVIGAFRKRTLSLSYVNIREAIRAFSALVAFLDSADVEKISKANNALKELIEATWPSDAKTMLAMHSLRDPQGNVAFSISGYVLQDDFMQECTCFVLELDDSGLLAGTQFTPFSLLQFLYKSGQVLGVQFASPASGAYLQVLFATVLNAEQLQMVLDIPEEAIHVVSMSAFDSKNSAWESALLSIDTDNVENADIETRQTEISESIEYTKVASLEESEPADDPLYGISDQQRPLDSANVPVSSYQPREYASPSLSSDSIADDKFALLEAELEGELFEEAISAGIASRSLDKAQQELPEKAEATTSSDAEQAEDSQVQGVLLGGALDVAKQESAKQMEELHGFSYERNSNSVTLYVSTIGNVVEAEQLRAVLLELLSTHADVELVLHASIRGNLELLQLLLSAAMTAGLRRQEFKVSGEGKESVAMLLAGCGITTDVLKAQGIADFLG